jgi:hypothetical protein
MEIVLSEYISWQYCIIFLILLLFILWLFFGGQENLQYIGLSPLKIGVDASRNVEHEKGERENREGENGEGEDEDNEDRSGEDEEGNEIDRTPSLPDVFEKIMKENSEKIKFTHSVAGKTEAPIIPISESYTKSFEKIEDEMNSIEEDDLAEIKEDIKSPRSLALGEFTCYKNEKISKGEMLCKKAIEDIYGVPFYCVRPDFLKNPETGRNLELDLYNDHLKIALEYSGFQHFVYPNRFHKTKEEFLNQVRRDQFKVDMCDKNGVYLITVPYNVPNEYTAIRKYIEYYLPENYEKRIALEVKQKD